MHVSRRATLINGSKNARLDDVVSEIAQSDSAPIIDLSKGELTLRPPEKFLKYAQDAVLANSHGYTATAGLFELREKISEYASYKFQHDIPPSQIAITAGAKPALYHALLSILEPSDEALILSPHWSTFPEQIYLAGGVPRCIDLSDCGYMPVAEKISININKRTKCIIVNSPNNPTGVVYTQDTMNSIFEMALRHDIFVILDQSYSSLIFESKPTKIPHELKDRIILVDSFSKAWGITGWRIGYIYASLAIIKTVASLLTHTSSNPNCIAQQALLSTLKNGGVEEHEKSVRQKLHQTWLDTVKPLSLSAPSLKILAPLGGFFIYVNVRTTTAFAKANNNIDTLCEKVLRDAGVLLVPGTSFGNAHGFRLSFSGEKSNIESGVSKLISFFSKN